MGKVIWVGLTLKPVTAAPAPLSGTEAALTPKVEEESTRVAALPPAVSGVKAICTLH